MSGLPGPTGAAGDQDPQQPTAADLAAYDGPFAFEGTVDAFEEYLDLHEGQCHSCGACVVFDAEKPSPMLVECRDCENERWREIEEDE